MGIRQSFNGKDVRKTCKYYSHSRAIGESTDITNGTLGVTFTSYVHSQQSPVSLPSLLEQSTANLLCASHSRHLSSHRFVGERSRQPQLSPLLRHPQFTGMWICYVTWLKTLCRRQDYESVHLKIERWPWFIKVNAVQSRESSLQSFLLPGDRRIWRHWKQGRSGYTLADFEDEGGYEMRNVGSL